MVIKLTVSLQEILEAVAKAVEEKTGYQVDPNSITLTYQGDYDTSEISGAEVVISNT